MGLTVKDLFDIDIFKNFKLIAGEKGLNRPITATEILDFEFVQGAEGMSREKVFEGESIILSSLLFAKDDPAVIIDAVKRLNQLNISCLAYKPVFIKELPAEAIEYANEHSFPILEFGGDEFFEDIIVAVRAEIGAGTDMAEIEFKLDSIIGGDLSAKETTRFSRRLNPEFRRYLRVVAIMDRNLSVETVQGLIKKFSSVEKLSRKAAIAKYRNGCFIFLSQDTDDVSRFNALLSDVFSVLGIEPKSVRSGFSSIRRTDSEFGKAVRESFWSCIVADLEEVEHKNYDELGIYRFIVPEINSQSMKEYMEEYLKPLMEDDGELLRTAKTYVLTGGELDETANRLYCHKNTVRYRLTKMQEMMDPHSTEKEFFENLALAIRIHMLMRYKESE